MELWMKIAWVLFGVMMIFMILPAAIHHMKNGPKGTTGQWMNAIAILCGVMLFVLLLMKMV